MRSKFLNKRLVSILILVAYLGVFAANVYHFHNVNFVFGNSEFFNQYSSSNITQHDFSNCLVQSTFRSIHISFIKPNKVVIVIEKIFGLEPQELISPQKNYLLSSLKLRAPPSKHS